MKVRDMMIREVITMKADQTIQAAFQILYARHVGSIIITNTNNECQGIFTERDAIRILATNIPHNTLLSEVMTRNVITVWEEASFSEAKQLFSIHGIRHLPVVDKQNRVVGMLSVRNILEELIGF
jgi:CBS domain-containing protein